MSELITTLGKLIASLGQVRSGPALQAHVALLRTKLDFLSERVQLLEQDNLRLRTHCSELEAQCASSATLVEKRGALFRRLADGGFDETPYCPVCHQSMWCFQDTFPYECSDGSCGHKANFKGRQLAHVLASLAEIDSTD
jgi:hypothetical protein